MILVLSIALISAAVPFFRQLRVGSGWGLIEAIEKKNFDVARELIIKRKGIHKVNEYNQNPLLLALEAGQPELARLLMEAGADVNIKSKMYKTPLRVATQSGNLEMVRLLISRGASLDAPGDEFPPAIYALTKGYDEITRVLIEAGTDLNRRYSTEKGRLTVGDIALLARKQELVDLIRQRGGKFTLSSEVTPPNK
jgi:ankyrin repeat protein